MRHLFWALFFLIAVHAANISAQEAQEPGSQTTRQEGTLPISSDAPHQGFLPSFRGRALVLEINARVVEQDKIVIWNETHQKTTLPGRPVGIKMVGTNLVVVTQFTPYIRRGVEKFLVAQGQVWMEVPGQGIRYYTSMQTIPLEYGEQIYFFPLGPQNAEDTARIEIMLTLYPYEE